MRRARRSLLVPACATLLLTGCAVPVQEPPVTISLVDALPAEVPRAARSALTVLVLAPQARPAYDTRRMAYTLRPQHLAYYARNEWAETPAQMLQPLLVRTLEATGRFQAVLVPPHAGAAALTLQVDGVELLQDFERKPPVLRLVLHAQLEGASRGAPAAREFAVQQPMAEASPAGGVRAANEAMARMLRELAGFVLENAR